MLNIPPYLYEEIYMWTIFVFSLLLFFSYSTSGSCAKLLQRQSAIPAMCISLVIMLFVGLRPTSYYFGDMVNYAFGYRGYVKIDTGKANGEWVWDLISNTCKGLGLSENIWFLIVFIGYLGFIFFAVKKLLWENVWIPLLFFMSAFSTWTFGVNGLRNGLACSLVTFAFALAVDKGFVKFFFAAIIAVLAIGIHKSVALPIAAFLAAMFVIKKLKYAIWFWILSIPLSFVAGGTVAGIFGGLGVDERSSKYVNAVVDAGEGAVFSNTGFRWDFLLYSAMPVLLAWYVNKKAENSGVPATKDYPAGSHVVADPASLRTFNLLATTYLLANAFWVMMIRVQFSNRFAYLSWFLYPIVIAYGVVRLHLWKDQDRKMAMILLAHAGFTMVMHWLGKC